MSDRHAHDPLQPHRHDPNLETPAGDGTLQLFPWQGEPVTLTVARLRTLPPVAVARYSIVSTGHGTSGPFSFGGAALRDVVDAWAGPLPPRYSLAVVSADGFGNRVFPRELAAGAQGPILLAYQRDGQPLTREQGLVRLIVPSETDDALRQVKWVERIEILAA